MSATTERKRRVLLLDPDERFAKLLQSYLDGLGWQVIWMNDARRALATLEEHAPDAVLMELELPHLDGFELIEAFAEHRTSPPVTTSALRSSSQGSATISNVATLPSGAIRTCPRRATPTLCPSSRAFTRRWRSIPSARASAPLRSITTRSRPASSLRSTPRAPSFRP